MLSFISSFCTAACLAIKGAHNILLPLPFTLANVSASPGLATWTLAMLDPISAIASSILSVVAVVLSHTIYSCTALTTDLVVFARQPVHAIYLAIGLILAARLAVRAAPVARRLLPRFSRILTMGRKATSSPKRTDLRTLCLSCFVASALSTVKVDALDCE